MIVEFSVKNYLSIKDEVTLSMVASNTVKELEDINEGLNNVFYDQENKNKYLKSAVIYGANGSGKSNLLNAIGFYRRFILSSSNESQANDDIKIIPFLLNTKTENEPSGFEMIFYIDRVRYRYGFEVTKTKVNAEWLFGYDIAESNKESKYFTRENQNIKVNPIKYKEGKGIENKTRDNALFLSTNAQLNGEISKEILNYLKININVISGLEDNTTPYTAEKFLGKKEFRENLKNIFKVINIGIEDIKIEETVLDNLEKFSNKIDDKKIATLINELQEEIKKKFKNAPNAREIIIKTFHKKYDNAKQEVENAIIGFDMESKGTQKLFALLGPWLDTIENGKVLVIDELDSRLHTKLTYELLRIFQSKINKKNAQLIFASHDTNLMRNDLFRRDQIWFTEKDEFGGTDLYSLVEYKINQATRVRNDATFEKDYLMGKYGAIPYFGNIQKFLNEFVYE